MRRMSLLAVLLALAIPVSGQVRGVGGVCTVLLNPADNVDLGSGASTLIPSAAPVDLTISVASTSWAFDWGSLIDDSQPSTVGAFELIRQRVVSVGGANSNFPPAAGPTWTTLTSALPAQIQRVGLYRDGVFTKTAVDTFGVGNIECAEIFDEGGIVKSPLAVVRAIEAPCAVVAKAAGFVGQPRSINVPINNIIQSGTPTLITPGAPVEAVVTANREVQIVPSSLWATKTNSDSYAIERTGAPFFYFASNYPNYTNVQEAQWFPDPNGGDCGPNVALAPYKILQVESSKRHIADRSGDVAQTIFANDGVGVDACTRLGLGPGADITLNVNVYACRCGTSAWWDWSVASIHIVDSGNHCP